MDKYKAAPEADNYVRGMFERLVDYEGQVPLASPQVNNPDQLCFDFLDRSYPVLDNFGKEPEFDYEDWMYTEKAKDQDEDDTDGLIELAQVCAVLRLRLDKVLSPPAYDCSRDVLPMSHLEETKALRDVSVLHISDLNNVSETLTKLGAKVTLITPPDKKKFNTENQQEEEDDDDGVDDNARKACAEAMRKAVTEATAGKDNQVFDIILADRYTLFWALACSDDDLGDSPSKTTESVVFEAIDKNRYQHVSSLWRNTGRNPSAACEVFVPKNHLAWRPWQSGESQSGN